jgi:hypothetical protein
MSLLLESVFPPHFTITKIKWLTPFKEIIAVNTKNMRKLCIKNVALLLVQADGTYSYRLSLKGLLLVQADGTYSYRSSLKG